MRRTKIVATLGPASNEVDIIKKLINAGINAARFNFSHGDYEEHGQRIRNLKQAFKSQRMRGILFKEPGIKLP